MSTPIFSGRVDLTNSAAFSVDTFDCDFTFFDGTGFFSGLDVQVGMVIFIDTFSSVSQPASVSKYEVLSVLASSAPGFTLRIKFVDTGTVVDPAEVVGTVGFIATVTANQGLAFQAAPTIHTIPDYVVQYARNSESFTVVEDNYVEPDSFILSALNITNKYVDLDFKPDPIESITVNIPGFPTATYGNDFTIIADGSGIMKRLSWDTLGMDGVVIEGDKLTVLYQR